MDFPRLELLLLNIGVAEHHADWNWANVKSPFARLYLVKAGSARVKFLNQEIHLLPGRLYFVPAFTEHSCHCDDYFALTYIHIYEANALWNITEHWIIPYEVMACDLDKLLFDRLLEINPQRGLPIFDPKAYDNPIYLTKNIALHETEQLSVKVETRGILLQLFSRFLTKAQNLISTIDFRVLRVSEHICNHITKSFTLAELAGIAHLSCDHLIRIFKAEMACTPVQFIHRKKIENAQIQLLASDFSVKEIAFNLSFESTSYFIKVFRNQVGLSPEAYRTEYKTGETVF